MTKIHSALLLLLGFLLALSSCQRTETVMEYLPVSTTAWEANDKLEFDIGPIPEDGDYDLYIEMRTTEARNFPYKELFIEVRQLWSKDDDARTDSLYHANDSLADAHRAEMAADERLITANDAKVGFNRRAQLQAEKERKADLRREGKSDPKPKPKPKPKPDPKKKGGKPEKPRLSPRDSIIHVTDSLIRALELLQTDIWRVESINDSIDHDRRLRVSTDTVTFAIDSPDDRVTGIAVRQYRMPVGVLHLLKDQTAHIVVRHIMRKEGLPGISDIGVTLIKH